MIATTATVHLISNETLEEVATKLQAALALPPFTLDSDMLPPHEITAMTDCLGYELWLQKNGDKFRLTVEASMDVRDRFAEELIDISEWLANHIRLVTDLHCVPV